MCQQSSSRTPNLPGNVDARLVGKAHAGRQRRRLAVDQIDRLVAFHADAVAGAVRQAREAGSPGRSPSFRKRARTASSTAPAGSADLRGCDRDLLAAVDLVPHLALLRRSGRRRRRRSARCRTGSRGPRSRSPSARPRRAATTLRLLAAVGIGRGLADQHQPAVIGRRPAACARRRSSRRCRRGSCPLASARRRSAARRA